MNRHADFVFVALALSLALAGCKQEPTKKPDHVIQQERQKKEKALTAKKQAQEKKSKKGVEGKKGAAKQDEDMTWPGPIRLAFYRLHTAKIPQWPSTARQLAILGLPAVPAIKRLLANKRQPVKKKALVSFLYVQLYMFRPEALTMIARDENTPFARRGSIEALATIGNKESKQSLAALRAELKDAPRPKAASRKPGGHAGHDHSAHGHGASGRLPADAAKRPFGPIIDFIKRAEKTATPWGYDAKKLAVLDSIFHAESKMKLKVALDWIKDDSTDDGLLAMLRSPVTRPQIHTAVIKHMVALAATKPKKFRDYCEPGYPQMLRMLAAKKLLDRKNPADRRFIQKLAANPRDPVSPFLQAILSGKMPSGMPRRPMQPK